MRSESKHNCKENYQKTRKDRKKIGKKNYKNSQRTINKINIKISIDKINSKKRKIILRRISRLISSCEYKILNLIKTKTFLAD